MRGTAELCGGVDRAMVVVSGEVAGGATTVIGSGGMGDEAGGVDAVGWTPGAGDDVAQVGAVCVVCALALAALGTSRSCAELEAPGSGARAAGLLTGGPCSIVVVACADMRVVVLGAVRGAPTDDEATRMWWRSGNRSCVPAVRGR